VKVRKPRNKILKKHTKREKEKTTVLSPATNRRFERIYNKFYQ